MDNLSVWKEGLTQGQEGGGQGHRGRREPQESCEAGRGHIAFPISTLCISALLGFFAMEQTHLLLLK